MKTYNSFSLRRVGLLVKRDAIQNWKSLLYATLGLSLFFLFLMYVSFSKYNSGMVQGVIGDADEVYFRYSLTVLDNCATVIGYYLLCLLSGIMANMRTQGGRTEFLMLPATNLEKFVSRALYLYLSFIVTFVVAILMADVLHMLVFPFFENANEAVLSRSLLPGFWKGKMEVETLLYEQLVTANIDVPFPVFMGFSCALAICNQSFFVLGGCYWRNHPFLKTFGTLFGLSLILVFSVLAFIIHTLSAEQGMAIREWFYLTFGVTYEVFISCWTVLFAVWAILNWYLAFRLFRRSQIV